MADTHDTPDSELAFDPDLDLRLTRHLSAPPSLVWRAWTDPAHLAQWWAPAPYTVSDCEIDPRPGGVMKMTMHAPSGESFPSEGCFLEVEQGRRIVFSDALQRDWRPSAESFFTAAITIEPDGDGTRYDAHVLHANADDKAKHEAMGFHLGWATCIDQLDRLSAGLGEGRSSHSFLLTRRIAAPRALVWRMWSEPGHLNVWCRPKDFEIVESSGEFREGGPWYSHIRAPDGTDYRLGGEYRTITSNELLKFTHAWLDEDMTPGVEALITVYLEDDDDGTLMAFHKAGLASDESADSQEVGWGEALDNLVEHMAGLGR